MTTKKKKNENLVLISRMDFLIILNGKVFPSILVYCVKKKIMTNQILVPLGNFNLLFCCCCCFGLMEEEAEV